MGKFAKFVAACAAVSVGLVASAADVYVSYEYVETSGGESVLLDYKPTCDSVVEATFSFNDISQNGAVFCARGNTTGENTFTMFNIADGGLRWDYNRTTALYWQIESGTKYDIVARNDGMLGAASGSTLEKRIDATRANYVPANKMMLFASYTAKAGTEAPAPTGNYSKMRLYAFKAYDLESGELVLKLDLVPCKDADGKALLYDCVNRKPYYAKGGGLKTGGEETGFFADKLFVATTSPDYGPADPDYGMVSGLKVGSEYTFTCLAVATNAAGTLCSACEGWTYVRTDGTTTSGVGNEKQLVFTEADGGATLTWQWGTPVRIKAAVTLSSVAVASRVITATYSVTALTGDGTTTRVTLEGAQGTGDVSYTDGDSYTATATASSLKNLTWTAPVAYFGVCSLRLRVDQLDADGNVVATAWSAVKTATTQDTATYTWRAVDGNWDGDFNDTAHWTCNRTEDRNPWPSDSACSVVFPANASATVAIPDNLSCGKITLNSNADIVFSSVVGAVTNRLTAANLTTSSGSTLTLDTAALTDNGAFTPGAGSKIVLKNGSDFYDGNNFSLTAAGGKTQLLLSGKSTASVNHFYLGSGNLIVLDDSKLTVRNNQAYLGSGSPNGTIRFQGRNPQLYFSNRDCVIGSNINSSNVDLEFLMPVGGFAATPVTGLSTVTKAFGAPNSSYNGTVTLNVLDNSPAAQVSEALTQSLISWNKGFDSHLLSGKLPACASGAAFDVGQTDAKVASVAFTGTSGKLTVTAVPFETGTVSTGYTTVTGLSAGEGRTIYFTAVTNDETRTAASARGWTLYGYDPATCDFTTELRSGTGATCDYVHPTPSAPTKLVWDLEIGYRVDVEPATGGHVVPESVWVSDGTAATVCAIPDAGKAFHHWDGEPGEGRFCANYTFTVTEPVTLHPVFGTLIEIMQDDGIAQAVLDAGENGVVRAAAGNYTLTDNVNLGSVRFEGAGRGEDGTVVYAEYTSARRFTLNDANAYLSGCRFTGPAKGVSIASGGGTVVDCGFIGNTYNPRAIGNAGSGLMMDSAYALVARCVFDGCKATLHGNDNGAGMCIKSGGTVENCLFVNCLTESKGGGLYVEGAAKIRNCTFHNNTASVETDAGANFAMADNANIFVYNCVFTYGLGYLANGINGDNNVYLKNTARAVNCHNCCSEVAFGTDGFVAEAGYAAPGVLDFTPMGGSGLVDKGDAATEFESLPIDLYGNPRVSGAAVDVGCAEFQQGPTAYGFSIEPHQVFVGSNATFKVAAFAADVGTCAWTVKRAGTDDVVCSFEGDNVTRTFDTPGFYDVYATAGGRSAVWTNYLHVGSEKVYVSKSGSKTVPFDTAEKATDDIFAAIDLAIDGATISFPGGDEPETFELQKAIALRRPLRFESDRGAESVVLKPATDKNIKVFDINSAGAYVKGLTLSSGRGNARGGMVLFIGARGGTVDGCIITNGCHTAMHHQGGGASLYGGRLINSKIVNNQVNNGFNCRGGGVLMKGPGSLENCLVMGNTSAAGGGGIYISHPDASVINCTVVGNKVGTSDAYAGGGISDECSSMGKGRIANCVFYGNSADKDPGDGKPEYYIKNAVHKAAYVNCAMAAPPPNDTCRQPQEFGFKAEDRGDYSLMTSSPLVDQGDDSYVAADIAQDVNGVERIIGEHVDIGAFEADTTAFDIGFTVSAKTAFNDEQVVFEAVTNGAPADAQFVWTVTSGGVAVPLAQGTGWRVVNTLGDYGTYSILLSVSFGGKTYELPKEDEVRVGSHVNYVVPNDTPECNPVFPFDSWETATTNVCDAVAAAIDGGMVILKGGTNIVRQTVSVTKAITLTSVPGAEKTVIKAEGDIRVCTINNKDAVVERVTLTGGKGVVSWNVGGMGCFITGDGGTLRDAIVCGNTANGQHTPAGGVTVNTKDGLVDRCRIFGNSRAASGQGYGSGVYMKLGKIRNSLIYGNSGVDGGLGAESSAVEIDNCTVVDNRATGNNWYTAYLDCGGIAAAGATVRNCVAFGNTCSTNGIPLVGVENDFSGNGTVENCALIEAKGTNCKVIDDPLFRRPAFRDYRLLRASPLVDAGKALPWMTDDSVGLDGKPRVCNESVDIGCYEYPFQGFLMMVR